MNTTLKSKRLLIVDDEPGICDVLSIILSDEGAIIETANSGSEAIEKIKSTPYDGVITDLNMPGGDGRSVLTFCKTLGPKRPRTLVCTAHLDFKPGEADKLGVDLVSDKSLSGDDILYLANQLFRVEKKSI
jgi:CheY-like chemotaxis protein